MSDMVPFMKYTHPYILVELLNDEYLVVDVCSFAVGGVRGWGLELGLYREEGSTRSAPLDTELHIFTSPLLVIPSLATRSRAAIWLHNFPFRTGHLL